MPDIINDLGVNQEMYSTIVIRRLISKGTGANNRATYEADAIVPKYTFANLDWTPDSSEASAATNGKTHKVTKTGPGNAAGSITGLSQQVLKLLYAGFTEEGGALAWNFAKMIGNYCQLNWAIVYAEGITRCYKAMYGRFNVPGSKAKAQDSKSAQVSVDDAITFTMEEASDGLSMFTKDFVTSDVAGIEAFLYAAYPPADGVAFTVVATTAEGALVAANPVVLTFSEAVSMDSLEGIQVFSEGVALDRSAYTIALQDESTVAVEIDAVAAGGWAVGDIVIAVPKSVCNLTGKGITAGKIFIYTVAGQ